MNPHAHATGGVDVVTESLGNGGSPSCQHGPTLLFERYCSGERRRFFACSACRDRKNCSFFQWADQPLSKQKSKAREKLMREMQKNTFSCVQQKQRLYQFRELPLNQRVMCNDCGQILLPQEVKDHQGHNLTNRLTKNQLRRPTRLLDPLDNNKTNAQYLFSEESLDFFIRSLERLKFTKVLCVGTPRMHEEIMFRRRKKETSLKSFLLDIDQRLEQFFPPAQFCRYNMFNGHFFRGKKSCLRYQKFVCDKEASLAVIMDPPFGGMVDVLAHTIKTIRNYSIGSTGDGVKSLDFLWIFPYFMQSRIVAACPDFTMLDYKVLYDNHSTYGKDSKPNTKGSPVRIFTTIKPSQFALPTDKYRLCEICQRYVFKEIEHCSKCDACTSQDGRPYVHCNSCHRCVKPSWCHCDKCDTCHLPDYKCQNPKTGCHVCGEEGHKRRDCPKIQNNKRPKKRKKQMQDKGQKKKQKKS